MNEYFLNGKSVSFDWITAQAKKANISTDEFIKNKKITQSSSKPKKPGFGDSLTIEDANPLFAVAKEATTENNKKPKKQTPVISTKEIKQMTADLAFPKEDNFLFTPEYKDIKAKKLEEEKELKKQEEAVWKYENAKTELRARPDVQKAKELFDASSIVSDEYLLELNAEIEREKTWNESSYNSTVNAGQAGFTGASNTTSKYYAFPEQREIVLKEAKRKGTPLSPEDVLNQSAELYKKEAIDQRIYDQRYGAMEDIDSLYPKAKDVLEKYRIAEENYTNTQIAKNEVIAEYTFGAVIDKETENNSLKALLKPEGYKFKTQAEVDEQNNIINKINENAKSYNESVKFLNQLKEKNDTLIIDNLDAKSQANIFNKEWGWFDRGFIKSKKSVGGFAFGILGGAAWVQDLVESPFRAVTDYLGVTEDSQNKYGKLIGELSGDMDKLYSEQLPENRSASYSLESFGENAASAIIDAVPFIATLALAPEAYAPEIVGGTVGFLSGTGSKYTGMLEEQEAGYYNKEGELIIPEYSQAQLFGISGLAGLSEAGTEYVGGKVVGRVFKNAKGAIGAATAEELSVIKNGMQKTAATKAKDMAILLAENNAEEIPAELLNNVFNNFLDRYALGKKDVNLLDNSEDVLFDTAVATTFFATAPTVASAVYRPYIRESDSRKLALNNSKIFKLLKGLDYEKLSPEEKTIIDQQITALKDESSKIISSITGMVGNVDQQELLQLDRASRKIVDLGKQLAKIENSKNLSSTQKDVAKAALEAESKKLRGEYVKGLNNAYAYEAVAKKVATMRNTVLKSAIKEDIQKGATFIADVLAGDPNTEIKFGSGTEIVNMALADESVRASIDKIAESIEKEDILNGAEKYTQQQKDFTVKAVATGFVNANGFFNPDTNTIFVNETVANRTGARSTARHEILHRVLKSFDNNMTSLGGALYDYVKANAKDFKQTNFYKRNQQIYRQTLENEISNYDEDVYAPRVENINKLFAAKKITARQQKKQLSDTNKQRKRFVDTKTNQAYEEVLTVLSESLAEGDIVLDPGENTEVKLNKDGNVVLNTAQDVFNFIANYNKAFTESKKSDIVSSAAKGKVTGALVSNKAKTTKSPEIKKSLSPRQVEEKIDKINEKIDDLDEMWANGGLDDDTYNKRREALENEIDALENPVEEIKPKQEEVKKPVKVAKEGLDLETEAKGVVKENKGKVASEKVQAAYNAKGINAAVEIIDLFKPITKALVNKRRDAPGFDPDLLTDEIETGEGGILYLIRKYDPASGVPLAAYINKYLPVRAITASRRVLDKDFSKDVEDQKGLMSTETAEQSFEDKDVDKPKYKNLLEQNIIEPSFVESIKAKALSTLRTLKTRIDAPVSINRTVTPIISEIKDVMGKQADIDLKTAMGGKKDNQFRSWLLKNKKATLENMTTTWLMGANGVGGIPQAVQKMIDGKWVNYPEWVGKKIDRESVSTDLAGRTSGADLVRRLPNAVNNVSDADYLGQFLEPSGNPIRGRKESLAKATAEEISFDIIKEDLINEGKLFEAFSENQKRLGVEIKEFIVIDFIKQVDRGNIKLSLSEKAKIDFENKTGELFKNINLQNDITRNKIQIAVNKTFADWDPKDKEELINKFTPYLRSAIQSIGKNFRNKGKAYEVKVKESIKSFTEANDDGVAIATRLNSVKSVSKNFKDKDHVEALQEINRDLGVELLRKKGQKKGLELLASFWYPSVAGRSSHGSKSIFKGSNSFKEFLQDIQEEYTKKIPFESINKSKKANDVSPAMMSGELSLEQKAADKEMSNNAWDFTVFAVEFFANKIKDPNNGFTNDHLASLLTSLIYERNSALRSAAPVVGILMDSRIRDTKKYDYDHSKPSRYVLSRLMDKFVDNKEVDLSDVKKDYVVTVIPKTLSKKLTKAGLRSMMPYYYKEGEGVQVRLKYATENLENTIKFSKSINDAFNQIIEDQFGIEEYKRFSAIVGKRRGASKGKYRFFIPPSAEDFSGLLYDFLGKGKKGEITKEWFDEVLIAPYRSGILNIESAKQSIKRGYSSLLKNNKEIAKKLKTKTPDGDFTYDQAIRVYLWQNAEYEVPGLTERDGKKLNELVNNDPILKEFASELSALSQQKKGWTSPGAYWDTETLLSDLANLTEGSNRKKFLEEFIQNSEVIFSEENMNKIRAALGNNWVEAMEDSLFRMKNGTNRSSGSNRLVNLWNNWVNNSTGAIMFFNRRSATLQLISATNFLNWSDNNPIKAATAFANQPQYWKDFAMLFNSDKLKERRSGLKTEVSESEIANAVNGAGNKAKAVMSYLLKIGFTPTQIADSLAIAGGGATFYRNRVNSYKAEYIAEGGELVRKYTDKQAEDKAFEDFSKTSDESQQSSDPSLVSMQQASSLGRLVLAFQNTPQQYMRLTKKAARDLINGRGDWKTNVSKIAYYTAVQNMVFSALQTGLFALLPGFDDDEIEEEALAKNKEEKIARIINSMSDTVLKGSGLYGAIISTLKNVAMEYVKQEEKGFKADQAQTLLQAASISPPIGSKLRKIYSATKTAKFEKDVMDERGFEVMKDGKVNLSPKYALVGNIASGIANIPLDRVYDEVNSISEALDNRNTEWQRIALALGWKTWDVGAENEENEAIKAAGKAKRKQEGIEKGKETRKKTNAKKKAQRSANKVKRRAKVESFTAAEEKAYMNMGGPQRKAYWEKFDKENE